MLCVLSSQELRVNEDYSRLCRLYCIFPFIKAQNIPFVLDSDDISQVASMAGADFMQSAFAKDSKGEKQRVLSISDFNNLSDFELTYSF